MANFFFNIIKHFLNRKSSLKKLFDSNQMNKQLSCHLQLKLKQIISELTSTASGKNSQNDNCMKDIKIEQYDLDETISTKNSNSIEKNKGMNLKLVIKLHD